MTNYTDIPLTGYRRENGRVGVRNHVIILPVDDISNAACEAVANNIKGTMALPHAYGRLQFGEDLDLHFRTMIGTGSNPNVAAVVVIGIEPGWTKRIADGIRETGKPVLLSVGYSACHWCHVMAHESFEDEATAKLMNDMFVNVKVDREERPDVDKIYQTAHQLLTQRGGGWPLTMFLSADDQRPFFGGTYFPNEPRYGMPSFTDLLRKVAAYYDERRDEVKVQGERLSDILGQLEPPGAAAADTLTAGPLDKVREQLASTFDQEYGGFGGAPKFPHPTTIDRLLRTWRASATEAEPDVEALFMATLTLTRMAEGGIYDHLGGGFCRYSVDRYWQIPHFEKMLYDNGPLLAVYAQAGQATGEALFTTTASETARFQFYNDVEPQDQPVSISFALHADLLDEYAFYVREAGTSSRSCRTP